jgi:hypothetical protein
MNVHIDSGTPTKAINKKDKPVTVAEVKPLSYDDKHEPFTPEQLVLVMPILQQLMNRQISREKARSEMRFTLSENGVPLVELKAPPKAKAPPESETMAAVSKHLRKLRVEIVDKCPAEVKGLTGSLLSLRKESGVVMFNLEFIAHAPVEGENPGKDEVRKIKVAAKRCRIVPNVKRVPGVTDADGMWPKKDGTDDAAAPAADAAPANTTE